MRGNATYNAAIRETNPCNARDSYDDQSGHAFGRNDSVDTHRRGGCFAFYLIVVRPKSAVPGEAIHRIGRAGLSHQRTVEREMSTLLVELTQMTQQAGSQLDTAQHASRC